VGTTGFVTFAEEVVDNELLGGVTGELLALLLLFVFGLFILLFKLV